MGRGNVLTPTTSRWDPLIAQCYNRRLHGAVIELILFMKYCRDAYDDWQLIVKVVASETV